MDNNVTPLCDLHPMLDDAKILARVISIWKSHPKERPEVVWSLDAVLQDADGNRIQATVRTNDIQKLQPLLDEGACYHMSNFGVGENGGNFPLLEHRFKITLFKSTTLTRVDSFDSNPRGFRFEHFNAFTSRTFSERELCDVIGTVVAISDAIPFNYGGVSKIRRTVIIEDFNGVRLECCFWEPWSSQFENVYNERENGDVVVIAVQLGKIKYFNGKPGISPAMYSSKLYINSDIKEIAAFKKRYLMKAGFDAENHSIAEFTQVRKEITADDFFKGADKKMVKNIRDSSSPYHCILYAKIFKIHRENGWTYLACNRCGRSAKEFVPANSASSGNRGRKQKLWSCNIHKTLTANAVGMRFKVIVRVGDDTGNASLLLFDDLVNKLSGQECVPLIKKHGQNHEDYFPEELNVLVGQRLLFRFHYNDDHITKNNHVYQVKMLSQDAAMVDMFKKDFVGEEHEDDVHTPLPSTGKSSMFADVDSIPFRIDQTPNSTYVASKQNTSHANEEQSSMSTGSASHGDESGKRIFIDLDDYDEEEAAAKRLKTPVQIKMEPNN